MFPFRGRRLPGMFRARGDIGDIDPNATRSDDYCVTAIVL